MLWVQLWSYETLNYELLLKSSRNCYVLGHSPKLHGTKTSGLGSLQFTIDVASPVSRITHLTSLS